MKRLGVEPHVSTMDHAEAVGTGAIERYVLREMDLREAARFEVHYFECEHCARQLRYAVCLTEIVRTV